MAVTVTTTGPLFDNRADELLAEMCVEIQTTVGDQAFVEFETNLELNIKHSGPIYQSFVQVTDLDGARVVNDGYGQTNDLQYGLWLEGIGSRNYPVTKFRGYHALRDAFESTATQAEELAAPIIEEYVDRINNE